VAERVGFEPSVQGSQCSHVELLGQRLQPARDLGEGLTAFCCHRGRARLYAWCTIDVPRFRAPSMRCASIILFADHAWILTVLSNVVAYVCRPSPREDRHHDLPCIPRPATRVSAANVWPPAEILVRSPSRAWSRK